jgi:hypothetical protein
VGDVGLSAEGSFILFSYFIIIQPCGFNQQCCKSSHCHTFVSFKKVLMTLLFGVLLYKFDLYEVGSQLNILQAESLFFVMTAFNQSTIKIFVYNNLIKAYFLTQVLSDARELSPVSNRIRIF